MPGSLIHRSNVWGSHGRPAYQLKPRHCTRGAVRDRWGANCALGGWHMYRLRRLGTVLNVAVGGGLDAEWLAIAKQALKLEAGSEARRLGRAARRGRHVSRYACDQPGEDRASRAQLAVHDRPASPTARCPSILASLCVPAWRTRAGSPHGGRTRGHLAGRSGRAVADQRSESALVISGVGGHLAVDDTCGPRSAPSRDPRVARRASSA